MTPDTDPAPSVTPERSAETRAQVPPARVIKLFLLVSVGILIGLGLRYLLPKSSIGIWFLGSWLAISVVVVFGLFMEWYLTPKREETPRKDVIDLYIKIASSALFIASLGVAWLSFNNTRLETTRTLELAQITLENNRAEQRSRRFMEALEKLGGETAAKRLAGVYAFTQLDSEFKSEDEFKKEQERFDKVTAEAESKKLAQQREQEMKQHWAIMEILTHFIQEVSPAPKGSAKPRNPDAPQQTEVYEIVKYLGIRKLSFETGDLDRLNLIGADLSGYRFGNAAPNSQAKPPNFEGALFQGAILRKSEFEGVNLRKAKFNDADLKGAHLNRADLTDADFTHTRLEGADLTDAILNRDDQLQFAFADAKTKCPKAFSYDAATNSCLKGSAKDARTP